MQNSQRVVLARRATSLAAKAAAVPALYSSLLQVLPQAAALVFSDGEILASNQAFVERLASGGGAIRGQRLADLLDTESWRRCQPALSVAATGMPTDVDGLLSHPHGASIGSRLSFMPVDLRIKKGQVILILFEPIEARSIRDDVPQGLLDGLMAHFPDDVVLFRADEPLPQSVSRLEAATGGTVSEAEVATAIAACQSGAAQSLFVRHPGAGASHQGDADPNMTEIRFVHISRTGLADEWIMAVIRKNVECPRAVEEYKRLAFSDPLTDLANRRAFLKRLDDQMQIRRREPPCGLGVFFIDLDEFKKVNDLGGHDAGDAMLVRVAASLQSSLGASGCVGRIGGDEFACFCPIASDAAADAKARAILDGLAGIRLEIGDRIFMIGASVGIAYVDAADHLDHVGAASLLSLADDACLKGKRAGGQAVNLCRVAKDEAGGPEPDRISEPENFKANELALFAMPVYQLQPRKRCGSEILLHLRGENASGYSPQALISAAERSGYIAQVDSWTLDQVLDVAEAQTDRLWLTVNVSADSAQDLNFREVLSARLWNHPLLATRVCLEITERDYLREPKAIEQFFRFVTDLGCQTAIDDFAGHWPVLSRLADLKVNWVKLDAGLTRQVFSSKAKASVVKGLIGAVHALGAKVIAKHTDSEAEAACLQDLGVDAAEGSLFGTPSPWPEKATRGAPRSA